MASVRQNRFGKLLGSKAFVGPMVGKIGGGESYLAEQLTVKATVENEYGESASATCKTNFTVVAVDVTINGVGEDKEETEGAFIPFVRDETNGVISVEGTNKMVSVSFSCLPKDLPTNEVVTISCTPPGELYEVLFSGELLRITSTNYPACEIAGHQFMLHGHDVSAGFRDGQVMIALRRLPANDGNTEDGSDEICEWDD